MRRMITNATNHKIKNQEKLKAIIFKSTLQTISIFCLFLTYHFMFVNTQIKDVEAKQDMQAKQEHLQKRINQLEKEIEIASLTVQKTQDQEIVKSTNQDPPILPEKISKLMENCKDQVCQTNQKLSSSDFLKLYGSAESKISFFFLGTETNVSKEQWNEKKDELESNLTTMLSHPKNTLIILSGFYDEQDKSKVLNRIALIKKNIQDHIVKKNQDIPLENVIAHLILKDHRDLIDAFDARKISYIRSSDLKRFEQSKLNRLDLYLSDSISIKAFPYLDEICRNVVQSRPQFCGENTICSQQCKGIENKTKSR
jgi:hypothetical protein